MTLLSELVLMLAVGTILALWLWWITLPEPPPSSIEEEIVRKAIARIQWRKRPTLRTNSKLYNPGSPHDGMLVTIPYSNNDNIRLLFVDGKVMVARSGRNDMQIELAEPNSIDHLARAIEHAWIAQYK